MISDYPQIAFSVFTISSHSEFLTRLAKRFTSDCHCCCGSNRGALSTGRYSTSAPSIRSLHFTCLISCDWDTNPTGKESARDHAAWVWQRPELNPGPSGSRPCTYTGATGLRGSAEGGASTKALLPLFPQSVLRAGNSESLL